MLHRINAAVRPIAVSSHTPIVDALHDKRTASG